MRDTRSMPYYLDDAVFYPRVSPCEFTFGSDPNPLLWKIELHMMVNDNTYEDNVNKPGDPFRRIIISTE